MNAATTIPAAAILEIISALDDACFHTSFRGRGPDEVIWQKLIRARAIVRVHLVEKIAPLDVAIDTDSIA